MRKTVFIKNAALITASSIILRFAGILFKVWLAARIGADGVGLYQLIFSLFTLAAAFAQSGIPTAVTRLVADETALGGKAGVKRIMRAAFSAALVIGAVTGFVMFFAADPLARLVTGDGSAALSIKVIAVSFVFMGAASVIRGYFLARRNAAPGAFSQLLQQLVRIGIAAVLLKITAGSGAAVACAAVFAGDAAAEIVCCLYLLFRYRLDLRRLGIKSGVFEKRPFIRIAGIALPLAGGRYLNSLLRAAENMLVPRALSVFSAGGAVALFGMIKGMAIPVLFFPSVVLGAVSTLLIPEVSEARARKMPGIVRCAVRDVLSCAAVGGFIFSALFAAGGYKIGALLYKSADVGFLLTALSPVVPLMYIDGLCDGLLKGLDQQKFTFRVSVSDSAMRLIFIFPVLTRFGINGFIGIMYLSNLYTCTLNVRRLIKISGAGLSAQKSVFIPVFGAFGITLLTKVVLDFFVLPDLVYIMLLCVISLSLYLFVVIRYECINLPIAGRMRTHRKYAAATITASLIK